MSASKKLIQASAGVGGGDFYPYTVDNSVRMSAGTTDYLTFTPSTNGNNTTFTLRFMVKRSGLNSLQWLFLTNNSYASSYTGVRINSNNTLEYFNVVGATVPAQMITSSVLRDVSSWYDIVISVSSTNVDIYVNGVEQPYGTNNPPNGETTGVNRAGNLMSTSFVSGLSSGSLDGYLAEMVLVDGQALTPDSFGEFKDGIWVPKDPSGLTFGTNGSYLDFADSANLGNDVSGNNNDFTVSGLTADDQMIDTPTNNFPTLNYLTKGSQYTFSNGNLSFVRANGADSNLTPQHMTMGIPFSGKWYFEFTFDATLDGNNGFYFGINEASKVYPGGSATADFGEYRLWRVTGNNSAAGFYSTADTDQLSTSYNATSGVMQIAIDMDSGDIWFGLNNSWYASGNPSTGANPIFSSLISGMPSAGWMLSISGWEYTGTNCKGTLNFGQTDFTYTPPTDFLALCTANLPEPTIGPNSAIKPSDVFGTVLYTGNGTAIGSGGKTVDCGVDMTDGDYMVAIKNRDAADSWMVFDTVRGATKYIEFDSTDAEVTDTESLNAFTSTGVTLGNNVAVNTTGEDYVLYWFKVTAGFFDIVQWTGTGAVRTVSHSLGVPPKLIIGREPSGTFRNWVVYCDGGQVADPETDYLVLDLDSAAADLNTVWNDTAPTSTVFTLGTNTNLNGSGQTGLGYLFADVEGFCKTGYYEGNGSADGSFQYLGFLPEFHFMKRTDSTGSWYTYDTARSTYNEVDDQLLLDLPDAETTGSEGVDLNSNGVKQRSTSTGVNASGGDYITLSIGTSSKYSNAR